jgi:hypothetical protein
VSKRVYCIAYICFYLVASFFFYRVKVRMLGKRCVIEGMQQPIVVGEHELHA